MIARIAKNSNNTYHSNSRKSNKSVKRNDNDPTPQTLVAIIVRRTQGRSWLLSRTSAGMARFSRCGGRTGTTEGLKRDDVGII